MEKMLSVLIVEDDPVAQLVISAMLESCNCLYHIVKKGIAALDLSSKYDLIFMDLGLPDISGIEAAKIIRDRGVITPIIALTAHGTKENAQKCLQAGMNEFLSKPLYRRA